MSKMEDLRAARNKIERLQTELEESTKLVSKLEAAVDGMGPLLRTYRNMSEDTFRLHLEAALEVWHERGRR